MSTKRTEERLIKRVEQKLVQSTFAGPIPPPNMLSQYNAIIPNGAERIMAMAEKQQIHRHGLEKEVVHSNSTNQRLGLILGFILSMFVAGGGFWLIYLGKNAFGIAAVVSGIATPGGIYIWGRSQQRKERQEKIGQ